MPFLFVCVWVLTFTMAIFAQAGKNGNAIASSSDTVTSPNHQFTEYKPRYADSCGEKQADYQLPKMTVTATSRPGDLPPYTESATTFSAIDIRSTAGAAEDIGRYIGTLPSTVASIGEGYNNAFFVRGGRPSEVVFLVDGIEMENINHFSKANGSGGPIGFINSDFLDNVRFFAGNMPAGSSPRLSSLVDIRMKNGSFIKGRRTAGCKLTGGQLSVEGPLIPEKSSFVVAGRYVDFMPLRTFIKNAGVPSMGDVFGKIVILAGESMDISATGLFSKSTYHYGLPVVQSHFDNTMYQNERIDQGGAGISFHYKNGAVEHEANATVSFRSGVNADSLAHFSDSFFVSRYECNPIAQVNDSRRHLTLSSRSVMPMPMSDVFLSFGLRLNRNDYGFSTSDESRYSGKEVVCHGDTPDTVFLQMNPVYKSVRLSSLESGAFAEFLYAPGVLTVTAGLRADYYRLLGGLSLSPRMSATLRFDRAGTFSTSCGMYHQFPTDMPSYMFSYFSHNAGLSNDSLQTIENAYLGKLNPLRCYQASCGYERKLFGSVEVKTEAYYKWYDREYNYICPYVQDIFSIDTHGNTVLRDQDGRRKAYGVEVSLRNDRGRRLFYSLAGSVLDVKNKYGGSTWRNDWTNVGYTFSGDVASRILKNHVVSLSLRGSGGLPLFSQAISVNCQKVKSAVIDTTQPYFSKRLSALLVANMRYGYSMKIGSMGIEAFIEVLNLFDSQPTLEYKFNGDRFVEVKPFGITPIFGCTVHL
jgi:hypothetical protein